MCKQVCSAGGCVKTERGVRALVGGWAEGVDGYGMMGLAQHQRLSACPGQVKRNDGQADYRCIYFKNHNIKTIRLL